MVCNVPRRKQDLDEAIQQASQAADDRLHEQPQPEELQPSSHHHTYGDGAVQSGIYDPQTLLRHIAGQQHQQQQDVDEHMQHDHDQEHEQDEHQPQDVMPLNQLWSRSAQPGVEALRTEFPLEHDDESLVPSLAHAFTSP